ncbi:aquaporin-like protein [Tothia fuscella]|uniref:Aquaporin-like protein n=1 Tax=Tothia fuscella TaxID=1048955 RepID=A0A9P4NFD9_9PEZI|nr:aquaporin-like protein [Tothia fuscella]
MNINEPAPTTAFALPFTKAANPNTTFDAHAMRLPFAHRIPDSIRNHFIAMCGEFVGTVLFLYFALSGAQVANSIKSSAGLTVEQTGANPQQLQYIALCFGFSLAVNAWVFFRISGGLFNPAVTIGMCLIGALPWVRGMLLFFVQILGGITAAALVSCMFPGPMNIQTSLGGGTSVVQGLFIEMMLTAQLIFTIFMLAAEKHKGTFIAPVGIGLSLFVAELTGVYFTGGSLNPARSFGPAVVNRYFYSYHWIYWLGPCLGAVLASGFYKFIKVLEFETANPDQDSQGAPVIARVVSNGSGQYGHQHTPSNETAANTDPRISKEWVNSTNGNSNGSVHIGYGTGAAPISGQGGIVARPTAVMRQNSTKPRLESPAMGTADEAFHGLAHGMHGDEDKGMLNNSRINRGDRIPQGNSMV